MAFGTRVTFDTIREISFGDVGATYATFGAPLEDHVRLISFNNGMDQPIYISFDGIDDHLRLAPNSFQLFDLSANKVRDDGLFIASGTQIYMKEVSSSPTTGDAWVQVMSAEGGK